MQGCALRAPPGTAFWRGPQMHWVLSKLYMWHLPSLAQGRRCSLDAPIPQGVVEDDCAGGPCHLL